MSRLTLEQSVGALINNGRFCDVHFIVGDDETKINGHRMLFALSSDVFEKMFYGELKDTSDDIRISDITAIGFMNMVRYVENRVKLFCCDQLEFSLFPASSTARNLRSIYQRFMRRLKQQPNTWSVICFWLCMN